MVLKFKPPHLKKCGDFYGLEDFELWKISVEIP